MWDREQNKKRILTEKKKVEPTTAILSYHSLPYLFGTKYHSLHSHEWGRRRLISTATTVTATVTIATTSITVSDNIERGMKWRRRTTATTTASCGTDKALVNGRPFQAVSVQRNVKRGPNTSTSPMPRFATTATTNKIVPPHVI
jgi:hypothetical protein